MTEDDAAKSPLQGILGMAIDGIALWTADAVRDGLGRLLHAHGPQKPDAAAGDAPGADPAAPRPDASPAGAPQAHLGTTVLLAVAVAAVVTVLIAGATSAKDRPPQG